ncbi:MAG: hypothetical protein XD78_0437 [Desulfotomaculum sp. 46_296]|nr:MAG: hypothetical protein XD78_0437 [Desulfotomaculum sp. 46_296]
MRLCRLTFQRILRAARNKVAEALVQGRTILIEGGITWKENAFLNVLIANIHGKRNPVL